MMVRTVLGSGVIAVLSTVAWVTVWPHPDPFSRLVNAAVETRPIEGRLTGGFRWAPYSYAPPNAARGHSRSSSEVVAAASVVQEQAVHDASEDARRSAAVAFLFEGKPRAALQELSSVASGATDARSWSDLAATRLHIAVSEDDPRLLPDALAAADAALHRQPGLPEAMFNRALVLERLGIRDQAREAWQRYLAADQSSPWAIEARERMGKLRTLVPFNQMLEKNLAHLANDPSAAHDVARSSPLEARLYGETMILGQWAEKESAGDHASSIRYLRIAREFGEGLANSGGDRMLQSAVSAIDHANAEQMGHLLRGQLLYRQAQTEFKSDHAAAAQPLFISAARELKLGGSPLTIGANFYLAHTFHALGNLPEARARERQLLTEIPANFPAYRAQVLWHLGLGYMADGQWGNSLTALNESAAIFDRLREEAYGSFIKELLAEVYDHIGDPDSAWAQRLRALHGIGAYTTFRLEQSLESAGRGAMTRKQFDVAASLLGVASDVATRVGRPVVEVQTRLLQARVFAETADVEGAQGALSRARVAASLIPDAAAREDASADLLATDAVIRSSPADSVKALTAAIEYHRSRGRKIALPELFLHRARAYRKSGQTRLAAADAEAGIAEVERHRQSLPSGEVRWGILDPSYELFEEAINLALDDGDPSRAFAYSERARSRELLDALQSSAPTPSLSDLDPNAAIVEYVPFSDRLVILVARPDGVHAVEQHVSRAELERDAATFSAAVAAGSPQAHRLASLLHRRLIEPIESELTGREMLVVVPGASLASLPFAALQNSSGAFLVERYTLVTAPSAAVYQRLRLRQFPPRTSRLLVVANPIADPGSEPLPETEREAKAIAAMYQQPSVLLRENATTEAFRHDAVNADVIHVATHGVAPMSGRMKPALLLAGSRLDAGQIEAMRLSHTEVVLLAACGSARGPVRSEGTISVGRAFLAAGVPSVIATLWSIDDTESARFFPVVHKYLVRGISPARSLRDAQVDAIRKGAPASLWAAVQCTGS